LPLEITSRNRLRSSPLSLTTNFLFTMSRPLSDIRDSSRISIRDETQQLLLSGAGDANLTMAPIPSHSSGLVRCRNSCSALSSALRGSLPASRASMRLKFVTTIFIHVATSA